MKIKTPQNKVPLTRILSIRILGFLLLGLIPFTIAWLKGIDLSYTHLNATKLPAIIITLSVLTPLILIVNHRLSQKENQQQQYPQIRSALWNLRLFTTNAASWIFYLLGYEFFFRGILLFSCIEAWGVNTAIVINTILYSLAHLHKGRFETLGAIPLGILFCVITLYTQSFWTAFILHCTIALSNDIFCIRNNPEISFKYS